jgi:DNA polymerase III delta subunit
MAFAVNAAKRTIRSFRAVKSRLFYCPADKSQQLTDWTRNELKWKGNLSKTCLNLFLKKSHHYAYNGLVHGFHKAR